MKSKVYLSFAVFLLIFQISLAQSIAQSPLPPEGLKAEMAEEWEKAIEVYRSILKQEPDRIDLWLRISDIEAHLGNLQEAAATLKVAAQLAPSNANIHFRLSQAYSAANQPNLALSAIERSIELEPENLKYLKAHAQLANWVGKSEIAAGSYEKILSLSPDDDSALLNFARSSLWSGLLDKAAAAYQRYLGKYPEKKEVYIEHAKTETWRGNYSTSLGSLEKYRQKFGESKDYLQEKARVLAWARRPSKAMELILPLLEDDPDNYEVNHLRTIALHYANRPRDAVESLAKLRQLRPNSQETEDTKCFVMNPLRPSVTFTSRFYTDSDDLDHSNSSIKGIYSLRPETFLEAGAETDSLHSKEGSGLDPIDGGEHAWHRRAWLAIKHRFSPKIAFDSYLGGAVAEGKNRPTYGIGLDFQPLDNLNLRLERDSGFYVISPRTVSLGIERSRNDLRAYWEFDLLNAVILDLGYDTFSDDNRRWEVVLSPRRSILRSRKFNLDCGLRGWWFSFDKDLDNGYYDPKFYQSYMVTGFGYWKISDNEGVSVVLDLGILKDSDMGRFHIGWGGNVEGSVELYRDIMLKIGGGIIHNLRQETAAFRAYTAHIMLTMYF